MAQMSVASLPHFLLISCRMQVNAKGRVCGVTKIGVKGIDPSTLAAMLETAQGIGPILIASTNGFSGAHRKK